VSGEPVHPAALDDDALLKQCQVSTGRAGGPGGQHRNKVETAVILTHTASGVSAQASERRSQVENKRVALKRLRLNLAVEHRCATRTPTGLAEIASELWQRRRQGQKLPCNPENKDFPALLAEAMDVLFDSGWDPRKAGIRLGVSSTQLVKLCKNEPRAMAAINEARKAGGQHALH